MAGRYSNDNISLCIYIISYPDSMKTPMAIVSIDKENAFNRMYYIFSIVF